MLVDAFHKNITSSSLRFGDNQLCIDKGKAALTYNLLYLIGSLPTSTLTEVEIPKCIKIEIICESHNQGWSDHPLVQSLQPGNIVGLWIRSQSPGWCHYVKRVEIKLCYTV
ncbi:hypothetical protein F8M41_024758 [Gigaspora margarita]|uniref:Uncharacterized protein n=1 Tax=Gigaspora margarita TaxID=4874 RepID=A0A8H3XNX8_GIGMA|nr:hypothetical protein F8M41_024758 [Gigaspora margarita]